MTCPEERVIDFLAGELSPEEERRFDEHLLGCEHCWRAVQADRAARLALEQVARARSGRAPGPSGPCGRPRGHRGPGGPRRARPEREALSVVRTGPLAVPHLRLAAAACLIVVAGRRQLRLARCLPLGARPCAGCCRRRHDDPRLAADHGSSGRRAPRHRRPAAGRARLPA